MAESGRGLADAAASGARAAPLVRRTMRFLRAPCGSCYPSPRPGKRRRDLPPRTRRRGDHPAPIARRGLARDAGPGQGSDSDVSRTGSAFSPARAPALPAPVGRRGRMMGAAHPRGVRQIVPPPQHERSAPSPASATADIPPRRLEAAAPEAPGKTRRSAPRSLVSQVAPRCGPPPRGAKTVTWARPPRDRSAGSAGHSRGTAPPLPAHRGITPQWAAST